MAPEAYNKREYTNKVDIWSLGVSLYELLDGTASIMRRAQRKKKHADPQLEWYQHVWNSVQRKPGPTWAFVRKTLLEAPPDRPSATECLSDPWFQECDLAPQRDLKRRQPPSPVEGSRRPTRRAYSGPRAGWSGPANVVTSSQNIATALFIEQPSDGQRRLPGPEAPAGNVTKTSTQPQLKCHREWLGMQLELCATRANERGGRLGAMEDEMVFGEIR